MSWASVPPVDEKTFRLLDNVTDKLATKIADRLVDKLGLRLADKLAVRQPKAAVTEGEQCDEWVYAFGVSLCMDVSLRTKNLVFPPLAPERFAFLERRFAEAVTRQPALTRLREVLMRHGGLMLVAPQTYDPDLDALLVYGRLLDASTTKLVLGRESDCHGNVSRLWRKRPEAIVIVVGYALSDDGLWRQHTWGAEAGYVIETTEPRLAYFGVPLSSEHAARFASANG